MKEIIKDILNKNAISAELQDLVSDEIVLRLTMNGYIQIDRIKLDTEKMACCVAKALDEMGKDFPFIIRG